MNSSTNKLKQKELPNKKTQAILKKAEKNYKLGKWFSYEQVFGEPKVEPSPSIQHVNPNCKDASRCKPHREIGKVEYYDWEKEFDNYWNHCFPTGGEIRLKHQSLDIKSFISNLLAREREEEARIWMKSLVEVTNNEREWAKQELFESLRRKIEKMKKKPIKTTKLNSMMIKTFGIANSNWNQALDNVLDLLKEL